MSSHDQNVQALQYQIRQLERQVDALIRLNAANVIISSDPPEKTSGVVWVDISGKASKVKAWDGNKWK